MPNPRRGREGVVPDDPFISVIAGIQPNRLGVLATEFGDDGFLDRLLFCYPSPEAYPSPHWTDAEVSEVIEKEWERIINRLHSVPMVVDQKTQTDDPWTVTAGSGKAKAPRPHLVAFTPGGKRAWVAWYDRHADEMVDPDFPASRGGRWSKMRSYAARIALVLSRLKWASDPSSPDVVGDIDEASVHHAVEVAEYFKAQGVRVQQEMAGASHDSDSQAILEWARRMKLSRFREAEVRTALHRFRDDPQALPRAIRKLEAAGAIRRVDENRPPGTRGPKPTPLYEVHPLALIPHSEAPDN